MHACVVDRGVGVGGPAKRAARVRDVGRVHRHVAHRAVGKAGHEVDAGLLGQRGLHSISRIALAVPVDEPKLVAQRSRVMREPVEGADGAAVGFREPEEGHRVVDVVGVVRGVAVFGISARRTVVDHAPR